MIAFYAIMFGVAVIVTLTLLALRSENKKKPADRQVGPKK